MMRVLIMPMNGTNNGTTFTDISTSSHTPSSVAGNTKTSTTQSKFYGSSGYFDGSGDYLDMGDSNDWIPQLGWTVEMWVYITGGTGTQRSLVSQSGSGATNQSFQILIQATNKFACSIRNNNGNSPGRMQILTLLSLKTSGFTLQLLLKVGEQLNFMLMELLRRKQQLSRALDIIPLKKCGLVGRHTPHIQHTLQDI